MECNYHLTPAAVHKPCIALYQALSLLADMMKVVWLSKTIGSETKTTITTLIESLPNFIEVLQRPKDLLLSEQSLSILNTNDYQGIIYCGISEGARDCPPRDTCAR